MFRNSAKQICRIACLGAVVLATGFTISSVSADDESLLLEKIYLTNGSTLYGTSKTVEENKFTFYVIALPDGGTLKLKRSQVRNIVPPPPAAAEYLKRKASLPDNIDAHWELADWCAKNGLPTQSEFHFMQVIRLKPDHRDARKRLGYINPEGVWIHQDHFYQSHGYVKDDRGKYRMPAGIRLAENKDRYEKEVSATTSQIRSIIKQYERRGDASLLNQLAAIKDPAAVTGLREAFDDELERNPPSEPLQKLIIETIGGIESYGAQNALIAIAMKPLEFFSDGTTNAQSLRYARDIREQCVRLLKQPHFDHAGAIDSVLPLLRPKPDTPVYQVHLAAWIVGELGDEAHIPWLIDGLVTTHRQILAGPGGNMTASQGSGGSGLQTGGDNKPKYRMVSVQNPSALDALKMITKKQDIGYDQISWLRWYIGRQSIGSPNLARDE